jgi:hypothetical protein
MSIQNQIAGRNGPAYKLFIALETVLREFIREELQNLHGSAWWRRGVPPDVREGCLNGFRAERSVKELSHFPHSFLYYANFPDLKKIIEVKHSWESAFYNLHASRYIGRAT